MMKYLHTLPCLLFVIFLIHCKDSTKQKESLGQILEEKRLAFQQKGSDEQKANFSALLDSIQSQRVLQTAKKKGEKALSFSLKDRNGIEHSLSDLLKTNKYVVLSWYRGGWCPYCNYALSSYQDYIKDFNNEKAIVVFLTPELPDSIGSLQNKKGIQYLILSDSSNIVAEKYGIKFKLPEEVNNDYNEAIGLANYNGNDSGYLPLSATYVIDNDFNIVYDFVNVDYRKRADPIDVLKFLKSR